MLNYTFRGGIYRIFVQDHYFLRLELFLPPESKVHSELCETSKEFFAKTVNGWIPWTSFAKSSLSDVWQGSASASKSSGNFGFPRNVT